MKRPVWNPRAERELEQLVLYYAQFDANLPGVLLDRVDHSVARLMAHPRLGVALPDSTIRKWRATGTPFLVFYRPMKESIRILKVRDARSDWRRN